MAKNRKITKTLDPFESSLLTERQWAVLKAKGKHLNWKRALIFIKNEYDIEISKSVYYEELARIKKLIPKMEEEFADSGLSDKHFVRKKTFEEITEEMWGQYYNENDPLKRVAILSQIANMEQLNSVADSDTALVIEKQIRMKKLIVEKAKAEAELKKKNGKRKDS